MTALTSFRLPGSAVSEPAAGAGASTAATRRSFRSAAGRTQRQHYLPQFPAPASALHVLRYPRPRRNLPVLVPVTLALAVSIAAVSFAVVSVGARIF